MKKPQARLQKTAGLFLFVAGALTFMSIATSESLYPGIYQTATNTISDLGTANQINSFRYQPAAAIFNFSMVVTGTLMIAATYLLSRVNTKKELTISLALFGIGVVGVGVFPANLAGHAVFAIMTFVFGALSSLASTKTVSGPFKYAAFTLGAIALCTLIFHGLLENYLGVGGTERWIVYPSTIWLLGMGGYLMSSKN